MALGNWLIPVCLLPVAAVILIILISQQGDNDRLRASRRSAGILPTSIEISHLDQSTTLKNADFAKLMPTLPRLSIPFSFVSRGGGRDRVACTALPATRREVPATRSTASQSRYSETEYMPMTEYVWRDNHSLRSNAHSPFLIDAGHHSSTRSHKSASPPASNQSGSYKSGPSSDDDDDEEEIMTPTSIDGIKYSPPLTLLPPTSKQSQCRPESPTRGGIAFDYGGGPKRALSSIPETHVNAPRNVRHFRQISDEDASRYNPHKQYHYV